MNAARPLIISVAAVLIRILLLPELPAQVASFIAPDTVCTGESITLTNTSTGGNTWYWSFCSGNALANPLGTNIGNPGNLLNIPGYSTLVKDGNTCYSFITNQGSMSVVRYNHGTSFSNNPVSWTNLGSFGLLSDTVLGIKILNDNGQWIGFVNNNNRIVRLNFGTSLGNAPTATLLGPYTMLNTAHCLEILKEGLNWVGFITCTWGNKLVRLNFGTSLLNPPVLTDLGIPGALNMPASFRIINENGIWYALVANFGNATMSRLTFGNSLFSTPSGVNLGVVCPSIVTPGGITLIRDCGTTTGFQLNYSTTSADLLWRLTFPTGITGPVTGTSLGNIGALSRPNVFSELFRVGDTLFVYVSNRQNFTLTRLRFMPCTNASVPSSALFNPPSFSYNQPGTYNVQLIVNEGLPTQSTACKNIVVLAAPCNVTAAFTAPDTVCVGSLVAITNQSTSGATSYYWSFCSGNSLSNPTGINIGNPGNLLNIPSYCTLVKDGNTCYSFITSQGNASVIRYNHGTSFSNNPVSWTNLGGFGTLTDTVKGIKILFDNGQWIGFVNNNNRIVRLNFGASLANAPVPTILGPYAMMNSAHCLEIFKEGGTWVGFITCSWGNKLVRLNFGASLLNPPVLTDLGTPGALNMPTSFRIISENGNWYALVVNFGNGTMSRLTFGSSLFNTPGGVNLGIVCPSIATPGGITLIRDCENTTGFQLNYSSTSPDLIWRLTFPTGITGPVTGSSLGNIGAMSRPSMFSELFRVGDTLFVYVTNRDNFTLTRLRFLPCSNASVASSVLYNPPPYSYNLPGTYNVRLIVNEGLSNQASICKSIIVMPAQIVNLGNDRSICPGTTTTLDAGAGFTSYLWSTGATTRMITVGNAGSYWAKVTKYGCIDYDTVNISLFPVTPVNLGPDPTICSGQTTTFNAGTCAGCAYLWSNLTTGQPNIGTGPTYTTGTPGVYAVRVTTADGCISRDTIQLFTNPTPTLTTWPLAQSICSGNQVIISLTSGVPGTSFSWTVTASSPSVTGWYPGNGTTINQILLNASVTDQTVTYHITPFVGSCTGATMNYVVTVKPVPVVTVNPPSQSVCNGASVSISLSSNISGTSLSWIASGSSGAISGYVSGFGNSIFQTLYNSGTTIGTVTYQIASIANGCSGTSVIYTVPVIPVPDVVPDPPAQTICSGNSTSIALTATSPLTTFSWTASLASGSITGFSGGVGGSISQILTNQVFTTGSVTYSVTAEISGCFSPPVTCPVTVNPAPAITNSGTVSDMCSGSYTGFTPASNVAGTLFTWTAAGSSPDLAGYSNGNGLSIVQQLFNAGFSNPSVTYTVIPNALGCNGAPGIFTVTVHPVPDIWFTPASTTVCTGQPVNIQLNSHAQPADFSWDATGSSAFITNYTAGTGPAIQQSPQNTGPDPETVTYTVTPASFGCSGTPVPYAATINPSPGTILSPHPGSLCSGGSFTLSFSSATTGTTFTWSASATSPLVSGYAGGIGNSISQTLENPGPSAETVAYLVTPLANGCNGPVSLVEVIVKPKPDVTLNPVSQPVCFGQQAMIALSSSYAGATCSWTATGSSPAVSGYANGNGNSITQTLYTTGTTTQTVTYFISSTLDGCPGPVSQATVLTYPVPDLTITPPAQSVCSGHYSGISLQSQVSGTIFQWTASGSPSVSGYFSGAGNSIVQLLNNSTSTQGWVNYTVTPTVSNCQGPVSSVMVNVYVNPAVSLAICSDTVTTTAARPFLLRGGLPPGGVYSGPGVDSGNGLFSPSASGAGLHTIIYSFSNAYGCAASNGCTIHVLPNPPFTCGGTLTDVRDGHHYATFLLPNGKCWMMENLDFGSRISDLIPQTDNCTPEFYINPNSPVSHPQPVYQWDELMHYEPVQGSRGLCPPGWHVPSSAEWDELLDLNTGPSQAAGPLKDLYLPNGFHAIPAGFNYMNRTWAFSGAPLSASFFWTSSASGPAAAIARGLNNENASVSSYSGSRANGFSVRCLKD